MLITYTSTLCTRLPSTRKADTMSQTIPKADTALRLWRLLLDPIHIPSEITGYREGAYESNRSLPDRNCGKMKINLSCSAPSTCQASLSPSTPTGPEIFLSLSSFHRHHRP
ncbi:hypothetical protein FRB93_006695 [Tulasnella sp. JGI-2019a]|nr:hypothetical protein FRB93_006695 [Tulasnella sp. JGI-2019a]